MDNKVTKRLGVKLITSSLTLYFPNMPIRVKDTLAKKVLEQCNEARAFWVIVKVRFEHVLYVGWVGCNDAVDFSGTAEDGGVGGATRENFGAPVEKTVAVLDEVG